MGLIDQGILNLKLKKIEDIEVNDKLYQLFLKTITNYVNLSDNSSFLFTPKEKETLLGLIDQGILNLKLDKQIEQSIRDQIKDSVLKTNIEQLNFTEKSNYNFIPSNQGNELNIVSHLSTKHSFINNNDSNLSWADTIDIK